MRRRLPWLVLVVPLLLPAAVADALELQPFLSGLSSPLYITHSRDGTGRLFIVEQGGVIKVVQPGSTTATVFLDISDLVSQSGGEQGLLGLAFHPQYATNGRFFVHYTRPGDGTIVIAQYVRSADPDVASTLGTTLLTIAHPTFTNHNGGMIEFGPDGLLYIGTGDGGDANDPPNNAQNIDSLLGKILRIDVDHGLPYTIPADNPFAAVGVAGRDEIFAFGLRNPFRFSFDRATGQLIVGDVGQGAIEEIDVVLRGDNMGWRVFEGSQCTGNDPALCGILSFRLPIVQYGHTGGRCSVTGGYVYRGQSGALARGTYVFGDFCTGEIFTFNGSSATVALDTALAISSFGEDQAGELYVVNLNGTVHRLIGGPTEAARQAFVTGFYANVLGRAPGADELAAWADFLRANCNATGVQATVRGFFGSPEFGARPLSLAGQVTVLYRTLLGRIDERTLLITGV